MKKMKGDRVDPPVVVDVTGATASPASLPASLPASFIHQIAAFAGILTPDGTVLEINDPALRVGGLATGDVLGRPFWECFWWSYDRNTQTELKEDLRRAREGAVVRREATVRVAEGVYPDGRMVIDFMLAPLSDERGRVTHLIPSGSDITPRKQAEKKLAVARTQAQRDLAVMQTVIDTAPVGISVMDRDMRWVTINERLAAINGKSVREHENHTLPELFPEVAAEMVPRFERVFETGEAILNEPVVTRTPAEPGVDRFFEVSVVPVRDTDGAVIYVSSIVNETTGRVRDRERIKRMRRQAERDRNELESIYHNAPVGLCVLDRELRWLRINEHLAEINGLTIEQHRGKTVYELLPGVADDVGKMVQRVLSTGRPVVGEEIVGTTPAQPGKERAWLVSYAPVFDEDGEAVAVNVITQEITERREGKRQLEEAVRQGERRRQRLAALNDVSPAGLCYHDADLVIRYCNKRLEDINGIANAELLDKHPYEVNEALALQIVPLLQRVLFTGEPVVNHQITWAPVHDPDRPHHYLVNYGRIEGEEGKADGVMSAVVDITEIIEQRKRLETWSQHLETEVARRTAELSASNRRLRDMSQEVMAAQNRERQRISKILHDDLQQTLAAAFLDCDLIARKCEDAEDPIHALKAELKKAVQTARDLSHDLFPSVLVTNGLPAALRWLAEEYRRRFRLEVTCTIAEDIDEIPGQARAFLYDVARELLFNVHKHADTPHADIVLQTRDDVVELLVHDNGKGCDPSKMLPDPDENGRPTARKSLGLPLIYHRLALLGGDMDASSVPGDGCKLTVSLPLDALAGSIENGG